MEFHLMYNFPIDINFYMGAGTIRFWGIVVVGRAQYLADRIGCFATVFPGYLPF